MQKAAGEHVFREKEAVKPAKLYGTWDGAGEAQKLCDYLQEPRLSYHLQPSGMVQGRGGGVY